MHVADDLDLLTLCELATQLLGALAEGQDGMPRGRVWLRMDTERELGDGLPLAIVTGWVHCLGRRTVTAVVLAAGTAGRRHISAFHRFFARAQWALDEVGEVVFRLALAWIPADQPLYVIVDDTLCRKGGKGICLASMHHDPLLSTARKPFFRFGHCWVVLALWVPLPMGARRGFALPVLFRLYRSTKRGGQEQAPSRPSRGTRLRKAQAAHAEGDRSTKMDAVLWASAPPRRPRQIGRPRRRGVRLPTPAALAATCRSWRPIHVTIYGREVTTQVFPCRALWYTALRDHPLRIVIVRDPSGKRAHEAFFCTDVAVGPAFILEAYARRWTVEVTFHDAKQFLGLEDPQGQTPEAVRRTAPPGPAHLRARAPLVRRSTPRRAGHLLAAAPLVPHQGDALLPGYAHRPAARGVAAVPFSAAVSAAAPPTRRATVARDPARHRLTGC